MFVHIFAVAVRVAGETREVKGDRQRDPGGIAADRNVRIGGERFAKYWTGIV